MNTVWLYSQGYHDPGPDGRRTDALLVDSVGPALHRLAVAGLVDRHHVLRYAVGGFHLRVRARTTRDQAAAVWDALDEAMSSCDGGGRHATYQPELTKYGGLAGLDLAERWFTSSTDFALGVLAASPNASERLVLGASTTLGLIAGLQLPAEALAAVFDDYRSLWASHGFAAADIRVIDGRLPSQLCGEALDRWERDSDGFADELQQLHHRSELACSQVPFLLNMAHLTNNRIGLSPSWEMAMVDLFRDLLSAGAGQ